MNLLTCSVAASILAFLPIALGLFTISASSVWGWSSGCLGVFCVSFLAITVRHGRSVAASDPDNPRLWVAIVFSCGLLGTSAGQVTNIALSEDGASGALYVAGILVLLALSAIQFVVLALGLTPRR